MELCKVWLCNWPSDLHPFQTDTYAAVSATPAMLGVSISFQLWASVFSIDHQGLVFPDMDYA